MRQFLSAPFVAALLLLANSALAADAKDYTPKNGMLTASIPPGEQQSLAQIILINNTKVAVEGSESKTASGITCTAASLGIPATTMRNIAAENRFDVLGDAIAKALGGKPGNKTDITNNGVAGKEFLVETKDGVAKVRLYTVGGFVLYAVVQAKNKDDLAAKEANAFLDGFKLSDNAKTTFQSINR